MQEENQRTSLFYESSLLLSVPQFPYSMFLKLAFLQSKFLNVKVFYKCLLSLLTVPEVTSIIIRDGYFVAFLATCWQSKSLLTIPEHETVSTWITYVAIGWLVITSWNIFCTIAKCTLRHLTIMLYIFIFKLQYQLYVITPASF